jgi:hypothetical protein
VGRRAAQDGFEQPLLELAHLGELLRDGGDGAVVLGEALALDAGHVAFLGADPGELLPLLAERLSGKPLPVEADQRLGAPVEELVELLLAVDVAQLPEEGEGERAVRLGKEGVGLLGEGEELGGAAHATLLDADLDEPLALEHGKLLADGVQVDAAQLRQVRDVRRPVDLEQVEHRRPVRLREFPHPPHAIPPATCVSIHFGEYVTYIQYILYK